MPPLFSLSLFRRHFSPLMLLRYQLPLFAFLFCRIDEPLISASFRAMPPLPPLDFR